MPNSECSVSVRRYSFESARRGTIRNLSGNTSKHECRKPGTNRARSLNDLRPEVGATIYWSFQSTDSDPEETSYTEIMWKLGFLSVQFKEVNRNFMASWNGLIVHGIQFFRKLPLDRFYNWNHHSYLIPLSNQTTAEETIP